jgi:hypothetical protein
MIGTSSLEVAAALNIEAKDAVVYLRPYMITKNNIEKDAIVRIADFENVTKLEEYFVKTAAEQHPIFNDMIQTWFESMNKP